ncbi:MAG: HEAT repeat domain-containing protein [Chloroflexota bacterium]
MQIDTTSLPPILLTDEQMKQFLVDGYLILHPTVPEGTHQLIDEKFTWLFEHETNSGNNILPRLPELNLVLDSPEVRGAMISLLGEDYLVHPHRYWHSLPPSDLDPNDQESVWARVQSDSHQDSYTPSGQPKSHYLRYARFMYYSHDVELTHGPTHVIPGSHYHAGLADEDRERQIPVMGQAGTVFLSHFDLGHAAGINLSQRVRHMIKFIFMRASAPQSPTWHCDSPLWQPPIHRTAPYDLEPVWRHQWSWLCGQPMVAEPTAVNNAEVVSTLVSRLNRATQAERTCAIYALAAIGEAAVQPLIDQLIAIGQAEGGDKIPDPCKYATITMEDAAYALAAIGDVAVDPLIDLLDTPDEWTKLNAIFALGEIGPTAQRAGPALITLFPNASPLVIRYAVTALGNIGDPQAQTVLCGLLNSNRDVWDEFSDGALPAQVHVHVNAAMALAKLGSKAAASEAEIIAHLHHPYGQVGYFLTEALRRIGTTSALEAVVKDLSFRRWDASLNARRQF